MVRQAHHERNQPLTIRPESFGFAQESLVEGLNQRFLNGIGCKPRLAWKLSVIIANSAPSLQDLTLAQRQFQAQTAMA